MNDLHSRKSFIQLVIELLVAGCVCFIGLRFTILGICRFDLSRIPGDYGDARFNMYILEHGYQCITGQLHSFWNAPFMFPFQNVIALSDNLLGTLPVYSLFRFLCYDRETSFQLWCIVITILNFAAAYYVLTKLTGHFILACAGAYVFAFSIFLFSQFNHAQMFPRFITPLVIYWTIRYFDRFQLKYFLLSILGVVYQFYSAMYLGFFLAMVYAVLFIIFLIVHLGKAEKENFFSRRIIAHIAAVVVGAALLIMPLVIHYLRMYAITGRKSFEDAFSSLPLPSSYFFASHVSFLWRFLSLHGIRDNFPWWDQQIFVGAIPWLALAATFIFFFRKNFIRENKILFSVSVALLLCIIITTRFGTHTFFKWIFKIPGFSSIGCVPRIMNIYVVLFSILLCLLINALVKKRRTLWFTLLLIAVLADNLPHTNEYPAMIKAAAQNRIEPIVAKINSADLRDKVAFAYLSDGTEEVEIQLDAMMASQLVHLPCINGYSSTSAPGFDDFWKKHNEEALNDWLYYNNMDRSSVLIVR